MFETLTESLPWDCCHSGECCCDYPRFFNVLSIGIHQFLSRTASSWLRFERDIILMMLQNAETRFQMGLIRIWDALKEARSTRDLSVVAGPCDGCSRPMWICFFAPQVLGCPFSADDLAPIAIRNYAEVPLLWQLAFWLEIPPQIGAKVSILWTHSRNSLPVCCWRNLSSNKELIQGFQDSMSRLAMTVSSDLMINNCQ
jgi:hypothetical protein